MKYIIAFNALYLTLGGIYFVRDLNTEFVIYILVILAIIGGVLALQRHTQFPLWMLWALSLWGLMHVLGGAVETRDGVLFAYRIYPLVDLGGEFYILKYDQFVHAYLYGLVGVMSYHLLYSVLNIQSRPILIFLFAVMASLGVSACNEIMEFFIALTMENGVGGYDNTMLDICFNFSGALIATAAYALWKRREDGPSVTI